MRERPWMFFPEFDFMTTTSLFRSNVLGSCIFFSDKDFVDLLVKIVGMGCVLMPCY